MNQFSVYVLPVIVGLIILIGLIKKVNVFDCFREGAKDGIATAFQLLPTYIGLITAVTMLSVSGGLDFLTYLATPLTKVTGIPKEVIPLAVLSPISGSGAVAIYENLLRKWGADSYQGRVASVMMGSSETTFYAVSVYYGAIGIKKTRQTIAAALCADMTCFVASALTVRLLLGT